MSYLKRHWIWSIAFLVLWLWLFFGTDIKLTWPQEWLIIIGFHCYGASQRNRARYEMERDRPAPKPRTSYLPGDKVKITLTPGDICGEFNDRHGIVTHGPDNEGGWIVNAAPGSLRCVAKELTMLTPREDR